VSSISNQGHRTVELFERGLDDRREFAVGDQQLGLAVPKNEGNGAGVETVIQRVQHRTCHRHAVVRF
jgi:hypothetical protein